MYAHNEGLFCKKSTLLLSPTDILYDERSAYQHIQVLEHHDWGSILLLDGVIQLCDAYEWSYHEMMVHVAMHTHPHPQRVLILGGGDGGCLRELLRYECVSEVVVCDIDPEVTSIAREYFPQVSCGYDDPRATLVHDDGAVFVPGYNGAPFDIVLIDSTDDTENPELGGQLHSEEMQANLKKIIHPKAIIVSYGDSPFNRKDFYESQRSTLERHFAHVTPYVAFVPMYQSGCFGFFMSSDHPYDTRDIHDHSGDFSSLRYYSDDIHRACQILPRFAM